LRCPQSLMKANTLPRHRPEFELYHPNWWCERGDKIEVTSLENNQLILEGSAAKLVISPWNDPPYIWKIEWEIVNLRDQEWSRGQTMWTIEMLQAAFGLKEGITGDFGDWIIERFGAESAEQGEFIRWETFLNIPGPGTGHQGDANISIRITEEIREAVRRLLLDRFAT
jgi:hypothetical protein